MKKGLLYICIIGVVFLLAMYVGYKLYTGDANEQEPTTTSSKKEVENMIQTDPITSVSSEEEKISPNANFILKKHYSKCNHTTKEFVELPKELVNLTKRELENEYIDWKVEEFGAHEVTLVKQQDGYCNEHYVIKPDGEFVAIYSVLENGEEVLMESTDISIQYLPQADVLRINEGIMLYGKEELNSALEDFE